MRKNKNKIKEIPNSLSTHKKLGHKLKIPLPLPFPFSIPIPIPLYTTLVSKFYEKEKKIHISK
jgi:hypothetical protein